MNDPIAADYPSIALNICDVCVVSSSFSWFESVYIFIWLKENKRVIFKFSFIFLIFQICIDKNVWIPEWMFGIYFEIWIGKNLQDVIDSICVDGIVIVCMLASSAVDRGFEPWLGQTKDYEISICCFSAKHTALRERAKTGTLGIRIMCLSGATCLPADCCFSELALKIQLSLLI